MNIPTLNPEMALSDAGALIATKISMREPGFESVAGGLTLQWKPLEVPGSRTSPFSVPIEMPRIGVDTAGKVTEICFKIGGEDETELTILSEEKILLGDDPFATDVLETFLQIYDSHAHDLCFRALRLNKLRRLELKAKQQAQKSPVQSHIDEMYANGTIRIRQAY